MQQLSVRFALHKSAIDLGSPIVFLYQKLIAKLPVLKTYSRVERRELRNWIGVTTVTGVTATDGTVRYSVTDVGTARMSNCSEEFPYTSQLYPGNGFFFK